MAANDGVCTCARVRVPRSVDFDNSRVATRVPLIHFCRGSGSHTNPVFIRDPPNHTHAHSHAHAHAHASSQLQCHREIFNVQRGPDTDG